MRIVQLANFYTPTSGGLRTCLDEVGRRYGEIGHERVLIVPGARDADEATAAGRRITIRSPALPGRCGYRMLVHSGRVLGLLDRLRPDRLEISEKLSLGWLAPWAVSHGVLFSHERLEAVLAARLPGWLPLVPAADLVNRRLSRLVERIVISSRFARAEYERICAGGLRLVPLGVNLDEFRPAALTRPGAGRSVLLVSVGRLSREKRPDRAVEALRMLRSAGVPAGLLVLGDGPMRPALQRSARDLPVRFLGQVPDRRGVAHLLAAADVAVAPSEVEAFGLPVLEALACGTPVVVPDRGAAPELIGPTGSGVITDGTPAGLADGVRSLLDVPEGVRRDSARSRAEQYPWSVTVSGLLAAHGLAPTFRAPAWTA